MKTTEKRRHIFGTIAFILAFAMLAASSMPVGASDDEALSTSGIDAQECVPIAEETWVLGLLDGDLPLDQLKSASLSDNDLPYVISRSLADERQHVNRLYEQEPDDYTVMFQNLDGGKTVYIFSVPVKSQSIEGSVSDMRAEDVISQTTVATAGVGFDCTSEAASVTFGGDFLAERLGNSASDHPLFDYNIGHCDVMRIGIAELYGGISSDGVDITRSAREWGKASDEQKNTFSIVSADLQNMSGSTAIIGNSVTSGDIICISMTYSTIAGEYALKHDTANKYLSNVNSSLMSNSLRMLSSLYAPRGKWLLEYQTYGNYMIRSQSNQDNYLIAVSDTEVEVGDPEDGTCVWFYDMDDGRLSPSNDHTVALGSDMSICDLTVSGSWSFTNHVDFVETTGIYIRLPNSTTDIKAIFGKSGETFEFQVVYVPSNSTYKNISLTLPDEIEDVNTGSEIAFNDEYEGSITISYAYKSLSAHIIPTIVGSDSSTVRLQNMIFNLCQVSGSNVKYLTSNTSADGVTYSQSQAHSSTNTTLNIKKPDDYNTQFYICAVSSGSDLFTVKSVKSDKYLSAGVSGTLSLASAASDNTTWRILELSDGSFALWNPTTTRFLNVNTSGTPVAGADVSNTHWTFRIGGVYQLVNASTGKYMTVQDGYDTDPSNADNSITVNIVTESVNAAGSLEDLDSNQHYRIVYKDDIGGYLLYPICSMNGSRRVIGKASSGAGQVVLKNYSSTSMDKVDITYAGTGASYTVKCGSYAMADSESSVVYSSYSSSATNQKWTFTADYSRIRDELQFSGIDIVFPVGGDPSITSGYGFREYTGYRFHDGVDIGVYNVGLKAPFDGTIVFVGTNSSDERGLYIVLKSNEYSNLYTHFYHLSSIDVIENQVVSKGETIGLTGSTGWGSGAHLHLIFSASSGNGPNNYIHTFDPLWFYPNIQFSRNDSTDSIIGGIRQ